MPARTAVQLSKGCLTVATPRGAMRERSQRDVRSNRPHSVRARVQLTQPYEQDPQRRAGSDGWPERAALFSRPLNNAETPEGSGSDVAEVERDAPTHRETPDNVPVRRFRMAAPKRPESRERADSPRTSGSAGPLRP